MYANLALKNSAMKDLITKSCNAGQKERSSKLSYSGEIALCRPVL
jgi:hypothetical protein